jgi:hypothetical protein
MNAHADVDRLALGTAGTGFGHLIDAVMDDRCAGQNDAKRLHHRTLQIGLGGNRGGSLPGLPVAFTLGLSDRPPRFDHHQEHVGVLAFGGAGWKSGGDVGVGLI